MPWRNYFLFPDQENGSWGGRQLAAMASQWGIDFDTPWKRLSKGQKTLIDFDTPWKRLSKGQKTLLLKGSAGKEMTVNWRSNKIKGEFKTSWEGLMNIMMRRYRQTRSESKSKTILRRVYVFPDLCGVRRQTAQTRGSRCSRGRPVHRRYHLDEHCRGPSLSHLPRTAR